MRAKLKLWMQLMAVTVFASSGCAAELVDPSAEPAPRAVASLDQELSARQCRRDSDCPQPGAPCRLCSDGSVACPSVRCEQKRCVYEFQQCPPEYKPCAGKVCGDTCQICNPADPDCVETAVVKYCQADSSCAPTPPVCETSDTCASDQECPSGLLCCYPCGIAPDPETNACANRCLAPMNGHCPLFP